MNFTLHPIAWVKNSRNTILDDNWGQIESEIILDSSIPEFSLDGIDSFSHLEIIYYFHLVSDEKAIAQSRHPRNNENLPKIGTFAQRNKSRPNKLGLCTVELISRTGNQLLVKNLDAINGTPILDIKPKMLEFEAKTSIIQPDWCSEILKNYW